MKIERFGHELTLEGVIFSNGSGYGEYLMLPGADYVNVQKGHSVDSPSDAEWKAIFAQTDQMPIEALTTLGKIVVRKCERQVDQNIAWKVYKRDGYACRYCARDDVPLTIDHLVLWEHGGPTIEENLLSSCRRCNKLRGNTEFLDWLHSKEYKKVSAQLPAEIDRSNFLKVSGLSNIKTSPIKKKR